MSSASNAQMAVDEVSQTQESSIIHITQQSSMFANEKQVLVAQLKNQQYNAIKKEGADLKKEKKKKDAKVLKI